MNKMKKLLSLLLCLVMVASAIPASFFGVSAATQEEIDNNISSVAPVEMNLYSEEEMDLHSDVKVEAGKEYATRIYMGAKFKSVSLDMVTYAQSGQTATISVFRWVATYDISKDYLVKEYTNVAIADNSTFTITFDETQAAGQYLFVISNTSGSVGIWTFAPGTSGSKCYENGALTTTADWQMKISFAETPKRATFPAKDDDVYLSDNAIEQYAWNGNVGIVAHSCHHVADTYGIRLNLGAPFTAVTIAFGTYLTSNSDITLRVYEWRGKQDYTVSFDPLVTIRREDIPDNSTQKFIMVNDDGEEITLPSGEYFFELGDKSGSIGVYEFVPGNYKCDPATGAQLSTKIAESDLASGGLGYTGAAESLTKIDWQMSICFTKTPATPFTACESTNPVVSNPKVPEEYTYPDDHLVVTHNVDPTTWVFTDGLGRTSYTYADVGGIKSDRTLAMFYWMWHVSQGTNHYPVNTSDIIERYPEAKNDYNHRAWPIQDVQKMYSYFWNEPIYGYYISDDEWVARKQAELLANAGVDVVFSDNTNGVTSHTEAYPTIYATWADAQKNGAVDSPKISYIYPFYGNTINNKSYTAAQLVSAQLSEHYLAIYHTKSYRSLWFYWGGKPMVMTSPSDIVTMTNEIGNVNSTLQSALKNFFTFRDGRPTYDTNTYFNNGQWGWLNVYPQARFYSGSVVEQVTVGVAQNSVIGSASATPMNNPSLTMGRSYTSSYPYRFRDSGGETNGRSDTSLWGYNLSQQFDYAISQSPKVIFVTGWNEWVGAGRDSSNNNSIYDQFTDEYSRDIEPSKGPLQDHYYYQLVNYVRKYKGCNPIPEPNSMHSIDIYGNYNVNWNDVEPFYAAYKNNTGDRDHAGYGYDTSDEFGGSSGVYYTETSGRNDIVGMKMARDNDYIYVDIECYTTVTDWTDNLWMNLYLDTNQSNQGWETFDYVVNKTSPKDEHTAVLEKFTGNGYTSTVVGEVEFNVRARHLTMKIKRSDLGLTSNNFTINFAATDNVHDERNVNAFTGDIMDFYISGDVAPGGRFKYSFISTVANSTHTCADTDDHNCDYCGEPIPGSVCVNNDTDDHDCDYCGETMSECLDEDKNHRCDVCGDRLSECDDFEPDGHFCSHCGKRLTKCEDCDIDPVDHLCDICGTRVTPHVDTDPADHFCDICGDERSTCKDVEPADHICDVCGDNVGCHDKDDHKCDACGEVISECADNNSDHYCDVCGAILSYCTDAETPDHNCDICGWVGIGCSDNNDDHKCDACGEVLSKCRDKDKDHFCDRCGVRLHDCADWDDHVCDWCGQTCSVCSDSDNHKCDICQAVISECVDDDGDGSCDVCGVALNSEDGDDEGTTRPSKLPVTESSSEESSETESETSSEESSETETESETESETETSSEEDEDNGDDEDPDDETETEKSDGCASAVNGIAIASIILIGSAFALKKKE